MKMCETRERLLEEAMNLIWTESFASAGVDEICRKTKIQKGSFYHFFPSKVALAVTALREAWNKYRPNLDALFSEDKPPVERLLGYLAFSIEKQKELKEQFGFYPGCPFTSLGIERGADDLLRQTAEEHLNFVKAYFEKTVADAVREGAVKVKNPSQKASELFSLYLGAFTRLRITNDIRVMKDLQSGMLALLGLEEPGAPAPLKLKRKQPYLRRKSKQLIPA